MTMIERWNIKKHNSVLNREAVESLSIKPDGVYLDLTFGRGGHSTEILKRLNSFGKLIIVDQDLDAIKIAKEHFSRDNRITIKYTSFSEISEVIYDLKIYRKINGIILDLGVSSPQIDSDFRGFSFMRQAPLDMRMNVRTNRSAISLLEKTTSKQLEKMLLYNGEEKLAKYISSSICSKRRSFPLMTTDQLLRIPPNTLRSKKKIHPSTRLFQTIRVAVNEEIAGLKNCLIDSWDSLSCGGKMVVISFHSLEDKIVKQFFRERYRYSSNSINVKDKGVLFPNKTEIRENPRSRSAHLRIIEK